MTILLPVRLPIGQAGNKVTGPDGQPRPFPHMDWGGGGPGGEDGNPDNPGGGPHWYWGGFDPRNKIKAPIGSRFIQTGTGGGLWVKTGPTDNDWTSKVTPPTPVKIVPNANGSGLSAGWTGSYLDVDELTANDADYMVATLPNDGSTTKVFEVNLTPSIAANWAGWTNAQIAVRSAYTPLPMSYGNLELRRVSNDAILASVAGVMGPGFPITKTYDLLVSAIEPYLADLKVRFTVGPVSIGAGAPSNARVYWAQLYSVS